MALVLETPLTPMIQLPRLYPILDTATLERCGAELLNSAEALLEAGVRILQLRHKGHYSRVMFEEARRLAALCASSGAQLVVNDRADIALLLEAAVHLGQDDLPPASARKVLGAAAVIGFSTHNEAQLRLALDEPADYLAFGPIFPTSSKANPDAVVGLAELARIKPLVDRPLVAIGGITLETASDVYAAGADSIAIIGDLFRAGVSRQQVRARAEAWLSVA